MSTFQNLIRRLAALAAAALVAAMPAVAETIGPQGESATPSQTVTVSDDGAAQLKGGGHTAALLWHDLSDFTNAVTAGATDEFTRLGIEVIATTNAAFDAAKQRSDIETALVKQPSIILSLPLDPVTSAEAFRAAVADGVKLVFLSNLPNGYVHGVDYAAIVTDDLFQMGKQAADALAEAMGGSGHGRLDLPRRRLLRHQPARQRLQDHHRERLSGHQHRRRAGHQRSGPRRGDRQRHAAAPPRPGRRLRHLGRPGRGRAGIAASGRQQDHPDRHSRPERAHRARHGAGRQRRGHRRRRGLRAGPRDGSGRRAGAARRGDAAVRSRAPRSP